MTPGTVEEPNPEDRMLIGLGQQVSHDPACGSVFARVDESLNHRSTLFAINLDGADAP